MNRNILLLAIATMMFYSCVTDDYDLSKDIDGSVCFVPSGFSLGGDNSADIPLSQIIELNDSGNLTTDPEGNYLFYKNGDDMDTTTVVVGQGNLCNAVDEHITYNLKNATTTSTRYPQFCNMSFETTKDIGYNPDKLGKSIRDISYISTPAMAITIKAQSASLASCCDNVTLKYEVPSFYDLADPTELTETINSKDLAEGKEHIIHITGVNFKKTNLPSYEAIGIDPQTFQMILKGRVGVKGTALISTADFLAVTNPTINVDINVGIMGTMGVTGRFDQEESVDIDPIELDNLPDFISEDEDGEIVIDVENPVVRVSIDNEVPADVTFNAILAGYKGNRQLATVKAGEEYGTDVIYFYGSADGNTARRTNVWISRKKVESLPDSVASNPVITNMNDLIRTVPDRVEINATARTDSSKYITLDLAKEYTVIPRYELVAPLKIGPNMKIVYNKTIDDLNDKLQDAEIESLEFSGEAVNNIPLDLHAVAYPLDANGNVVSGVTVNTEQVIAGSKDNEATTTPFTFTVSTGSDPKAIQKVYSIKLKMYGESSEKLAGQYLNKNQDIRINHAKMTLKGAKYKL